MALWIPLHPLPNTTSILFDFMQMGCRGGAPIPLYTYLHPVDVNKYLETHLCWCLSKAAGISHWFVHSIKHYWSCCLSLQSIGEGSVMGNCSKFPFCCSQWCLPGNFSCSAFHCPQIHFSPLGSHKSSFMKQLRNESSLPTSDTFYLWAQLSKRDSPTIPPWICTATVL